MMQKLADDPSFWIAVAAVLAWVTAWAKVKAAEYEARSANGKADTVAAGQGVQQVTLVQHTAQIAALEAVASDQGAAGRGQGAVTPPPVPPAAPVPTVPLPSGNVPTPMGVTTPTGVPVPLSSSPPATEHTTAGAPLGSGIVPPPNGYPPPPET